MTSSQAMKTDDPWKDIGPPSEPNAINARRISGIGSLAWGLYWAIDSRQQCLLILQHRAARQPSHRLPRLRGLLVEDSATEDGVGCRVIIRLTDREQREVFHRFCTDVVEATRLAQSEEEAIGRFLTRTWRWHRLLRSGRDGRLSDEEQKGLIGELRLLETHLLPEISAGDAVEGWVGPTGAPKDFQIGPVCVEAKARSHQKAAVGSPRSISLTRRVQRSCSCTSARLQPPRLSRDQGVLFRRWQIGFGVQSRLGICPPCSPSRSV